MLFTSVATITRPNNTTTYAQGDEVQGATPAILTFANVGWSSQSSGNIVSATLTKSGVTGFTPNVTQFRLYLFDSAVAVSADNAPMNLSWADSAFKIGTIDFPILQKDGSAGVPGVTVQGEGVLYPFLTRATASLFGRLICENTYPPEALEMFRISLGVKRD